MKRLLNGFTTQIHSPCGQAKICQKDVDIFLASLDHLSFLVVLNKRKNKSMGNCISKTSKDRLLGLEEFMKNATSVEKGKVRPGLDRLTRGNIYKDPFHEEVFKNVGSITN